MPSCCKENVKIICIILIAKAGLLGRTVMVINEQVNELKCFLFLLVVIPLNYLTLRPVVRERVGTQEVFLRYGCTGNNT